MEKLGSVFDAEIGMRVEEIIKLLNAKRYWDARLSMNEMIAFISQRLQTLPDEKRNQMKIVIRRLKKLNRRLHVYTIADCSPSSVH